MLTKYQHQCLNRRMSGVAVCPIFYELDQ